jgi:hypothetical protein
MYSPRLYNTLSPPPIHTLEASHSPLRAFSPPPNTSHPLSRAVSPSRPPRPERRTTAPVVNRQNEILNSQSEHNHNHNHNQTQNQNQTDNVCISSVRTSQPSGPVFVLPPIGDAVLRNRSETDTRGIRGRGIPRGRGRGDPSFRGRGGSVIRGDGNDSPVNDLPIGSGEISDGTIDVKSPDVNLENQISGIKPPRGNNRGGPLRGGRGRGGMRRGKPPPLLRSELDGIEKGNETDSVDVLPDINDEVDEEKEGVKEFISKKDKRNLAGLNTICSLHNSSDVISVNDTFKNELAKEEKPERSKSEEFMPMSPTVSDGEITEVVGSEEYDWDALERNDKSIHDTEGGNEDSLSKTKRMRKLIAEELLNTEETYVTNLQIILDAYLIPLYSFLLKSPFFTIKIILGVNQELLTILRNRIHNWSFQTQIGGAMVMLAPYLKMYSTYARRYEEALSEVHKLLSDPQSKFSKAFFKCSEEAASQLTFESLVIQPIQRIPRYVKFIGQYFILSKHFISFSFIFLFIIFNYENENTNSQSHKLTFTHSCIHIFTLSHTRNDRYNLLLRDLLMYTPEDHPDYESVKRALAMLEEVTVSINEHVRQEEKVREING